MGASGAKLKQYMENLERKVARLQRFDCVLEGFTKFLGALQDAIGETTDDLHQFDQSRSADLQSPEVDISLHSSSIESPRMEQTVSGGYDSALEYLEDFLECGEKIEFLHGHPFKPKPDLAAGAAELATSMSHSSQLETSHSSQLETSHSSQLETSSHEKPHTLKPDLAGGDAGQTSLMSGSSQLEDSDETLGTKEPDFAVGDTEQSALDAYMATLETVGDLVLRQQQEQSTHIRHLCQGSIVATPENSVKTSIRCWMEYVTILEHSRRRTKRKKPWRKFRLSAVWASKNCHSRKMLLDNRGEVCKQIKDHMSGLDQHKREEEKLQQDIALLEKVTIKLSATNKDFMDRMHETIIHVKTSGATELQELMPELQTLNMSLQELHTEARDCLVPYKMATAAEKPPACIDMMNNYKVAILQESLQSLENSHQDQDDADLEKLTSKVAMAEAEVNTAAKWIVERDPVSATTEVMRSLAVLNKRLEVFFVIDFQVEGRTFEQWLPDILRIINLKCRR
ncbi:uncharacterized protein LOC119436329 isoform X2 [Dermacentor silvarum]|uniref:uncharacterized protein LOC119436329 isoform X2 n=1 Tax=Dermacentor silvarum TaxID=543639 RepID=UPI0018974CA7|nr:uncharacterized protein LOC119436329 isoform X2 [Dermacentor silvarum]